MRPDRVMPTEILEADLVPWRRRLPDVPISDSDAEERELESNNRAILWLLVFVGFVVAIGTLCIIVLFP